MTSTMLVVLHSNGKTYLYENILQNMMTKNIRLFMWWCFTIFLWLISLLPFYVKYHRTSICIYSTIWGKHKNILVILKLRYRRDWSKCNWVSYVTYFSCIFNLNALISWLMTFTLNFIHMVYALLFDNKIMWILY